MSCLVECYEENGMYYAVDEERVDPSQQQETSGSGDDSITGEIDHNVNEENEIHEDTSHNTGDATSDDTSNDTTDDESDSSEDAVEVSSDDSSNETNDETTDEIDEQAKKITAEETSLKETSLRMTRQREDSDLETQTGITDHRRRSTKLSTKQGMSIEHSTGSSTGSSPHSTNDPMPEESSCHSCTRFDSWDTMIACSHPHDGVERWFHLRCADVSPYAMPQDDEEWFCKDCKAQLERNKTTRHHGETARIGESDDAPSAAGARHDNNDHQVQDHQAQDHQAQDHQAQDHQAQDDNEIRDVATQEDLNQKNQDDEELDEESVAEDDAEYSSVTDNPGEQRKNRRSAPISKRKPRNTPEPKLAAGATQQQAAPARIKKKSEPWTQREKDLVAVVMQQVIDEQEVNLVEKRWQVISERLLGYYDVTRSSTAVKNYWNREGRQRTGIDERRKPNPDKLVTGVQHPEDRRKARQEIARMAGKGGRGKKDEDDDDDDDDDNDDEDRPRVKRRKRN